MIDPFIVFKWIAACYRLVALVIPPRWIKRGLGVTTALTIFVIMLDSCGG